MKEDDSTKTDPRSRLKAKPEPEVPFQLLLADSGKVTYSNGQETR